VVDESDCSSDPPQPASASTASSVMTPLLTTRSRRGLEIAIRLPA
jgi:hypothetical protein